jgi:cytochrome P450
LICSVFEKPEIAEILRAEIDSVIKSDADITVANLRKLRYLECVINETSRKMCPAVGMFVRKTSEDTTLGGVPIQKGTIIDCFWLNMLFNSDNFKNPMEFIPERWESEECSKHQQLISIMFSGGPRGCIGKNLALTETKIMVIKFMKRYGKMVEIDLKERVYEIVLAYFIKNTNCVMTKNK